MHMLVSHWSSVQKTTPRLPSPLKTQIRHHRGHQTLIRQLSLLLQDRPPEKKDMVTIHHTSLAINSQHAIGIPIKAKTHGGALLDHRSAQRLKMCGSAIHVDPRSIGITVQHREIGAKSSKHLCSAGCCRPPAEIQHDGDTIKSVLPNAGQQAGAVVVKEFRAMVCHSRCR